MGNSFKKSVFEKVILFTLFNFALYIALLKASSDISIDKISASLLFLAIAIDIQPDPVPTSRIFGFLNSFIQSNAISTTLSVSGLGINTFGDTDMSMVIAPGQVCEKFFGEIEIEN